MRLAQPIEKKTQRIRKGLTKAILREQEAGAATADVCRKQRPLEALEEQAFGLRRQRPEGERLEGAELRDDLEDRDDHADEEAGLAVVGPESLLVVRGLDMSDAKRLKALEKIFTMTRAPNFAFHL